MSTPTIPPPSSFPTAIILLTKREVRSEKHLKGGNDKLALKVLRLQSQ